MPADKPYPAQQATIIDMTNKELYAAFCNQQPDMPIMMQPWWLEAVCAGKQWDVLLFTRSELNSKPSIFSRQTETDNNQCDQIVAAMPYLLSKRLWYKFIIMPQMTMFGGLWLNEEVQASPDMQQQLAKLAAKRLREMRIAYYYQQFAVGNPMPHWLGKQRMQVEHRVTYRINNITDIQALTDSFSKNKKRQLEHAENLSIDYSMTAEEFYRFHTQCMAERDKRLSYSREFLLVLERKAKRVAQGAIIRISQRLPSNEMQTVAAAFVVWDKRYLYYLIPAYLPSAAHTGASARLALEAVRLAKEKGVQFDFEGGNDSEGIANHYKQFASTPATYYSVCKLYRPTFALLLALNKWKAKLMHY